MERLWFITNPHSGSSDAEKAEAIEAACAERGLSFVGRTDFPDQTLPTIADLDRAGADTVVLFAGDGTINAASCALMVVGCGGSGLAWRREFFSKYDCRTLGLPVEPQAAATSTTARSGRTAAGRRLRTDSAVAAQRWKKRSG